MEHSPVIVGVVGCPILPKCLWSPSLPFVPGGSRPVTITGMQRPTEAVDIGHLGTFTLERHTASPGPCHSTAPSRREARPWECELLFDI